MTKRWQNEEYGNRVRSSIRASFNERWADPNTQKKVIKVITSYSGSSKLEKSVADIAMGYGYKSSIAIGRYLADILNYDRMIVVEVNGDYWHCNPSIWKPYDFHPFKKKLAREIWDQDNKRKLYLESLGYTVYVVWEQDILKGKEKFIRNFFETINANQSQNSS